MRVRLFGLQRLRSASASRVNTDLNASSTPDGPYAFSLQDDGSRPSVGHPAELAEIVYVQGQLKGALNPVFVE